MVKKLLPLFYENGDQVKVVCEKELWLLNIGKKRKANVF